MNAEHVLEVNFKFSKSRRSALEVHFCTWRTKKPLSEYNFVLEERRPRSRSTVLQNEERQNRSWSSIFFLLEDRSTLLFKYSCERSYSEPRSPIWSEPCYRYISSVHGCTLRSEGLLPFDFEIGACNSIGPSDQATTALLCFDGQTSPYTSCHT